MTLLCVICERKLKGRQKKYCSRKCKNSFINNKLQCYEAQQGRGRHRKLKLIAMKGSACEICGYNRNYAALELHHTSREEKSFQLDLRSLSNRKWEKVLEEAKKCRLLCSNCHAEEHNPECFIN
jgi:hypothetical protein